MTLHPALEALAKVAHAVGETDRIAFVGGAITGLYDLRDVGDIRPTKDVDCIVDVADLDAYYTFVDELQRRGFEPCTDPGAPLCRQVFDGLRVDIMPTRPTPIGPTNVWYDAALTSARSFLLAGRAVRAIAPIYFVATKIEAFKSRGNDDFMASHDMEDLLAVLGGLSSLRAEIESATTDVAEAVRAQLIAWRVRDAFMDALGGHFPGDAIGDRVANEVRTWIRVLR